MLFKEVQMKCHVTRIVLFALIFMMPMTSTYAQESSKVENAVNEIVRKYDGTKGVNCISVVKGSGLELVKMMLKKEFGKSFMSGVRSITILDYSDASQETCQTLRKELDVFKSILTEFNIGEVKEFSGNDYIRCFVSEDSGKLSDFVISLENKDSKTVIYMAGEIVFD